MGRSGHMFAWQGLGVAPDIMTSAKALGCGVPVGAFLLNKKVAEKSLMPGDHGTTYGGNPLVGAAVTKVLEMMERDRITQHVQEMGDYLSAKLDELVAEKDCLSAHRGVGLIQGVVCKKKVGEVSARALEHGLIVITAGSDVIRFVPPLIIEKKHVDEMIEKLSLALDEAQ
jgi:acetylornithine/N-succinyldiaminopimelate aminotransferase